MGTLRVAFLFAIALSTSLRAADLPSSPPSRVRDNAVEQFVPFRLVRGFAVVVKVKLGTRNLNALVDTSAYPSILDSAVAAELGTEVPTLRIGPICKSVRQWKVRDLSFIKTHIGMPIDAVIGMDFLASSSFTLDYERRRITFGQVPADDFAIPFESGAPPGTIAVTIGSERVTLLVDSAMSGLLLFRSRASKQRLPGIRLVGAATGHNVERQFPLDQLLLQNVLLGDTKLDITQATIAEDWPEWDRSFDGLLGISSLKCRRVSFDLEAGTFRWKP